MSDPEAALATSSLGSSLVSTRAHDDNDDADIEHNASTALNPPEFGMEKKLTDARGHAGPAEDDTVVSWDGPGDPANPMNWSSLKRTGHVVIVGLLTLLVNLTATLFAPGAADLLHDFGVDSAILGSLSVAIQLLGTALGPLLLAPLSELYGRCIVYHATNVVFFAFTVACATSPDMPSFLVFRFITGCAGSAPQTIGGGTIADLVPLESRGAAMGLYSLGPMFGPILGPIMGGFIAENKGWRWTFWIASILSGVLTLASFAFMRETYAPVLLARKAAKLRHATGNAALRARTDTGLPTRTLFARAIVRPLKLLLFSPMVLSLALFCAFAFGLIYLLFTTFPAVFERQYGFSPGVSGLSYLGLGIGMLTALAVFSALGDKILKQKTGTGVSKPEYRLPLMVWLSPLMPIGFFWYGWTVQERVHWIAPIIGTSFVGMGAFFVMIPAQIYLVDAFGPSAAASSLAAFTLLRSLFGTFLPLAGPYMYASLGYGWGNSLLGFIGLVFAPLPLLFYHYGERVRQRWPVKL